MIESQGIGAVLEEFGPEIDSETELAGPAESLEVGREALRSTERLDLSLWVDNRVPFTKSGNHGMQGVRGVCESNGVSGIFVMTWEVCMATGAQRKIGGWGAKMLPRSERHSVILPQGRETLLRGSCLVELKNESCRHRRMK